MQYILLELSDKTFVYQEIFDGKVLRNTDEFGNTVELKPGVESKVIDAEPLFPVWGLPDPIVVVVPQQIFSREEFLSRLTTTEIGSLIASAAWKFSDAGELDMDQPEIIKWLADMETAGLITKGRADEIRNVSTGVIELSLKEL